MDKTNEGISQTLCSNTDRQSVCKEEVWTDSVVGLRSNRL